LNQFEADDYNNIRDIVKESLMKKIESSDLKANAQNRLLSELSKFFILTKSMGWKLEYNQSTIESVNDFKRIDIKL
jgi:hypothetical protein